MKITIVGEQHRAETWEKFLRKLPQVKEVVFMGDIPASPALNIVLLIDNSAQALSRLLQSVKNGNHTYLISRLTYQPETIGKIHKASEEAGVFVQFSHWPTLSDSIQWIKQTIKKPTYIAIKKNSVQMNNKVIDIEDFNHEWMDEIALIVGFMGGNIHKYEIKPVTLRNLITGFSATLRFENASLVSFQFSGVAGKNFHQRIFSSYDTMIDFDVISQKVTVLGLNDVNRITRNERIFDPSNTAEKSLLRFLQSVQLHKQPLFSGYDALAASKVIHQISSFMEQNR